MLLEAAKGNLPEALLTLGDVYAQGLGVEKNLKTAFSYYRRAADVGDGFAQQTVAQWLMAGKGVPADRALACHYFVEAATDPLAYLQGEVSPEIGKCYETGAIREKSLASAVKWYGLNGRANAARLGALYLTGEGGVPKDPALAGLWFEKGRGTGKRAGHAPGRKTV